MREGLAEFIKSGITPILTTKFLIGRANIAIMLLISMMHHLEIQVISITVSSTLILTLMNLKAIITMMLMNKNNLVK
jgi:hypothetical protein